MVFKRLFLPPVIEKNIKSGYRPPVKSEMIASLIAFTEHRLPRTGFLHRRTRHRLTRLGLLHYPIEVSCKYDECVLVDSLRGRVIENIPLIAESILLIQHPSPAPYLEPSYIPGAESWVKVHDDVFLRDDIVVPKPRQGEAYYHVAFPIALVEGEGGRQLTLHPPIYFLSGLPGTRKGLGVFRNILALNPHDIIDFHMLENWLLSMPWILDYPGLRKSFEAGVNRLVKKGILDKRNGVELLRKYL